MKIVTCNINYKEDYLLTKVCVILGIEFQLPYKKYKENESYEQNEDNLVISDDEFDLNGVTDSISQNDNDDDESNLDWLKNRGIDNTFKNVACPLMYLFMTMSKM